MPLEKAPEEARRILDASRLDQKITLKLFGGLGVYFTCPSALLVNPQREYVDIDFMAHGKQSGQITQLFTKKLGYLPRERFNALNGSRRLIFNDMEHGRRVDIFFDVFEMSHKFDFRKRMDLSSGDTLTLADLLATKLQIFEINEKDLKDALTLFVDHDVSVTTPSDGQENNFIDGAYLAGVASADWGVYKTFGINLEKVLGVTQKTSLESKLSELASSRINKLRGIIEEYPKSLKWKIRAKVGEGVRWYELPEEDREVIDSRIAR